VAITKNSLTPTTSGWAVNATTADASSGEELVAAPGAGKYLVVNSITVISDANITVTIGSGESGDNVEATLFGPIPFGTNGGVCPAVFFNPGVRLPANKSLSVDASGAGNVCVIAQGVTI